MITQNEQATRVSADTDLIKGFLAKYERPNTIRIYRYHLTRFFGRGSVNMKEAAAITTDYVNKQIEEAENVLAPATVEGFVTATSVFFDWLCAMDIVRKNPADKHLIRKRRKESRAQRKIFALSKEESQRLLDATLVDPLHDRCNTAKRNHAIVLTLPQLPAPALRNWRHGRRAHPKAARALGDPTCRKRRAASTNS